MPVRESIRRDSALRAEEREEIFLGIERGLSNTEIAAGLGRSRATVWREITRNGGRSKYRPFKAAERAVEQARRPKVSWVESRPELFDLVVKQLLVEQWSPEQISGWLKRAWPDDPQWWVSHESIYTAVYVHARPELRRELAQQLRRGRTGRKPRSRASNPSGVGRIKDMTMICDRPSEVEDRVLPGHWEGDLIIGANGGSAVATLVERTTRYGKLVKIENRSAAHVAQRLAEVLGATDQVRSLTWDQGKELADHKALAATTGIGIYFCDARHPWQRGSNENWNGLVRQYLPKGTDLSVHSQTDLDLIAAKLNRRPRKTLGYNTPQDKYNELVATTA